LHAVVGRAASARRRCRSLPVDLEAPLILTFISCCYDAKSQNLLPFFY
jgi:hypothetical protein